MSVESFVIPDDCKDLYILRSVQSGFYIREGNTQYGYCFAYQIIGCLPKATPLLRLFDPSRDELKMLGDRLKDWTQTPLLPELAAINIWDGTVRYTR